MMEKVKKVTGYGLFLPLSYLLIVLFISLVTTPALFKISITNEVPYGYIVDVINHASELVVLAVGMILVVFASAGTDVPVGTVMAVAASIRTHVLVGGEVSVSEYANPYIPAVLAGLAVAVLCGCFDGFLVAKLKVQPIVATLILLTAGRGTSQLVTNGRITHIRVGGHKLLSSNIPGTPIPTPILVAVLVVVLIYVFLKKMAVEMYVQAVGTDERVSRLVSLKPTKIIWMAYAFCGLYAGITELVASSRIYSTDVDNTGLSVELSAIAAMALGGNPLGGGKFPLLGSAIGACTIQTLTATLYAMSVPSDQIPVYKAITVIIIVTVQSEEFKKLKKRLTAKRAFKTVEEGVA